MARLAGVDLPREKRIEIALTYIFGIGPAVAQQIIATTGINPDTRVKDLTEEEEQKLRAEIENNHTVDSDEYQASHGHRLLPWSKASPGSPCPRSEDQD